MNRVTLFWSAAILLTVLGLYQVKYQVRDVKEHVTDLEDQLRSEYKALHVLEAEWAYLNRPDRLQRLSNLHLQLSPLAATQMSDLDVLELLPPPAAPAMPIIPASGEAHGE